MAEFDESKHPRDKDGKFTEKGKGNLSLRLKKFFKALREKLSDKLNQPITEITEEAISKIKYYDIEGYSKAECEYITKQHKSLLRYARDNNKNNEVAYIFRKGFTEKIIVKGDETTVNFTAQIQNKGVYLFVMHNHPRNSSFSLDDLQEFFENDSIKTLSVAKNNGGVEIITKTQQYNKETSAVVFLRGYREFKKNKEKHNKITKNIMQKLQKGGFVKWIK